MIKLQQYCQALASDIETPVGFFMRQVGERPGLLLESAAVDGRWGRYSIIATDFVLTATCVQGCLCLEVEDACLKRLAEYANKPFIEGLQAIINNMAIEPDSAFPLPAITRGLYGYLGYGVAGMLEPRLAGVLPARDAEACLVLPGTLFIFDHTYNRITRISLRGEGGEIAPLPPRALLARPMPPKQPLAEKENYLAALQRVKDMLYQGEAIQIVLSVPFSAPLTESPFTIYRRLRRLNPSPYMFYMRLSDGIVLGSSPEVLVTCEANSLRLSPIAGTRPRGQDPLEDVLFGDELLQDPKEQAEHVMLVDLGRNDLGRIAKPGSVKVERYMEVERFSHVMHLTSRISADLQENMDISAVLRATFPAGTVSGAPKVRAMEIIAAEEKSARGPYAGAIGWLGLDKDSLNLDLGILIRSMWIREGRIHWQAGAGLVHDSLPEKEWRECLNKALVIKEAVLKQGEI